MRLSRRILVASLILLLCITVGGAAIAYWSGSGAGPGTSSTGSNLAMTLSPGTPVDGLRPGGSADVVLTVSNPNQAAARVGSLVLDQGSGAGGYAVDPGHLGCGRSALGYTAQTNGGSGWTVPAKVGNVDGTLSITLRNALTMSLDAANACQGASITVYLAVGP